MLWTDYRATAPEYSPGWAVSDRGWLWSDAAAAADAFTACLGHYLDYGPEHYRSGDTLPTGDGGEYAWRPDGAACACRRQWPCRRHQPGNVHAVSVVTGAHRYCETVQDARRWLEAQAAEGAA
jgi:hypothetical protein